MFKSKVSSLCNQDDRKSEEFLLCWISNEPHGCVVIRKNLSQKATVCVCVPHLLCVCGGGDGGGAGAGGHPVVLPFAIWLLVGTQRVHVSVAAEHVAQSLQRLRTTAAKTKTARGRSFKFHHRTTSCCIQYDSHRITKVADKLFCDVLTAANGRWVTLSHPSFVTELSLSKALKPQLLQWGCKANNKNRKTGCAESVKVQLNE